ncbi:MAG TPA: universal stress protein [Acidimicrobiia bacterium]|nr:universal stress protein [Acidimicrobiia bacterium]
MRILIATTGALSPEPVSDLTAALVGDDGIVTVITVIEVPRSFLDEIRSDTWHPLADGLPEWAPAEDAVIARYVSERGHRITEPLLAALRSRSIEAEVRYLEGEDPAETIVAAGEDVDADVIVIGATKQLFTEQSWESVSSRVLRETRRPCLVIPAVTRDGDAA